MPKYTVRVRHEQVRYAEVEIEAETVPEAAQKIGLIPYDDADSIAEPGEWDVEHEELTVEKITDEEGNTFLDEEKLLTAWETETEV